MQDSVERGCLRVGGLVFSLGLPSVPHILRTAESTGRWLWVQITRNKEKPRCEKENECSFSLMFNAKDLYSHEKFLEALDSS